MERMPVKYEMYLPYGRLGFDAMKSLYAKLAGLMEDLGENLDFMDFAESPLLACKHVRERVFVHEERGDKLNGAQKAFMALLSESISLWEKADGQSDIRKANMDPSFRPEPVHIADNSGKKGYGKKWLVSGFNWLDADWRFPDAVIAKVFGVSRQAVSYHRNALEKGESDG